MIQCALSTSISRHFAHPLAHFSPIPTFSWCLCVRRSARSRAQKYTALKNPVSILSRGSSKWAVLLKQKGERPDLQKMQLRQAVLKKEKKKKGGGVDRKLLVRTKKKRCDNVLSLQMYQFTRRRSRLHPFPARFLFLFVSRAVAHPIIIHNPPHHHLLILLLLFPSAVSALRENWLTI